jgi:hypothetical protein
MAFSQSKTQIQWSSSDTKSVAGGGTENSDDFTASTSVVDAEIQLKADHSGTPASGDTIDWYLQRKGDPDQDTTDEYDNQGDFLGSVDLNSDDPAVKTIPVHLMQGQTYRLTAVNNDSDTAITVSARLTEVTWS